MVYVDSVFVLNALMDYLLVLCAARLAGIPLRRRRYLLAGLLGGAYAVAVFLPGLGFLSATPVKLAAGILLALAAYGGEAKLLRLTLLLFAVSCAMAGCVLALGLVAGGGVPMVNGVFYTDVDAKVLLTAAAAASLLLAPFYPALLLLFVAIYAVNMYIHYSNKINISLYTSAVKQLSTALKTARYLAAEGVPGSDEAAQPIRRVAEVEHRSRIVGTQGDGGNELAAVGWLAFELVKIAFNIEVILFHRFTGSIATHRDAIHDVFRFIGRTDAAISVMRLRRDTKTCRPTFTDGKYLEAVQVVHPLIEGCTANTLTLDGTGLLLTGSNMSGKTTFIRTVMLNALLGETLCTCFAERFTAPYMRLHSSIRISDDITEGTSYYLQEVLTVKRLLEDADRPAACLFVLDELFKGTNTTERIAAGKAVLARLNRGPHIVLAATHDIELAELLRGDGYELHHFREEVADGRLVFDYCLHTGPLTTRNAIRILELYDYPPELIAEAYDTQQKLLAKG